MSISDSANKAAASAEEQIAQLRAQIEALMKDRVGPAVNEAAHQAQAAMGTASDAVRHSADAVSGQVRAQPLLSIVVAAGIGFLIGRIVR